MPVHPPPGPGTRCGSIPGPWLPPPGWQSTRLGSCPDTRGRPSAAHRGSWSRPGLGSIAGEVRDLDVHVSLDVQTERNLDWFLVGKHDRQVPASTAAEGRLLGRLPMAGFPHLAGCGITDGV